MQGPPRSHRRFILHLSDYFTNGYKKTLNREPTFSAKNVDYGLDDDEVVVAALFDGYDNIPLWEFGTMLSGDNDIIKKHPMLTSSDADSNFGLLKSDLAMDSLGIPPWMAWIKVERLHT